MKATVFHRDGKYICRSCGRVFTKREIARGIVTPEGEAVGLTQDRSITHTCQEKRT